METEGTLPEGFEDLAPFAEAWALPTLRARHEKRRSSTMEEIRRFYEAMLPRMDAIVSRLEQFPLGAMPEAEKRLLDLALAFMVVSPAVELFHQPTVPYGYDAARIRVIRPSEERKE